MRVLRAFVYGSIALMLTAGWGYLWQSGTIDLAAGMAARRALDELRTVDARWDDELGAARAGALALGAWRPLPHDAGYAWLEVQALRLPHPHLGLTLGALRQDLERKAALVRRTAAGEGLYDEARRVPVGERFDELSQVLERAFADALERSERFRTWLVYYSAGLLVLLGYLAFALRRAALGLEQRVAERTRELADMLQKLRESEVMLVQSEKMSALGQMVAGLAHEMNTPLAYVKASLEVVSARAADAERLSREVRRLLELIEAEDSSEETLAAQLATVHGLIAERRLESLDAQLSDGLHGIEQIVELVRGLKDFSRLERGAVVPFDLHQGIEATLRIAQNQLGRRSVKKVYGAIPAVACAPAQVNQVLLNLLVNAAQATREADGAIVVRTAMRDAQHVAIEVADNGPGIPKEVLPRIFDPFFTTKEIGKGTGLGLSISYKIVQAHGGRLEVDSRPGAGTRFTVVLPVRAPELKAA